MISLDKTHPGKTGTMLSYFSPLKNDDLKFIICYSVWVKKFSRILVLNRYICEFIHIKRCYLNNAHLCMTILHVSFIYRSYPGSCWNLDMSKTKSLRTFLNGMRSDDGSNKLIGKSSKPKIKRGFVLNVLSGLIELVLHIPSDEFRNNCRREFRLCRTFLKGGG
jgi:hypothetical protein